jgi:KaiC/GvpD/RAD55 family RecA-like ATPase
MDGMMGGGATSNPNSWIISVILFGAGFVVAIGLVLYFFYPKNKRKEVPQKLDEQLKDRDETFVKTSQIKGYLSTGNPKLDNLLYGGFAPNSSVMLIAPPSHERDSIIKSFIETGIKNNEITFYISIDYFFLKDLITEFPLNFYIIVCNPKADNMLIKAPNVHKVDGVSNLSEINIELTKAVRKLNTKKAPRRVCINIVSDVLLQYGPVRTRKWLTNIISLLESEGFTILAAINPKMHSSEDIHALLGLFGGEIIINEMETTNGDGRRLKIKRMNNQKYLKNEILLT